MKANHWKAIAIVLMFVLLFLAHSSRTVLAQDTSGMETYLLLIEGHVSSIADDVHTLAHGTPDAFGAPETETYHVTEVDNGGDVRAPGKEVKGFSCVSDVHSNTTCYILSK